MALLKIENLEKAYLGDEGRRQLVLSVPRFELAAGEQVAIKGASGCGKTTFLHLIAGMARPTKGSICVGEVRVDALKEAARDRFRALNIGYVFQSFHLMRDFTALENVELGMSFGAKMDRSLAKLLLKRVGLGDRIDYRASQLSVGQQQRVAVARALANRPKLVLADEPTGSLDERASELVVSLLQDLCNENEAALLLVSHEREVVDRFEKKVDFGKLNMALVAEEGAKS